MDTQILGQVDLAMVFEEAEKRHFYFKLVSMDTYKGEWSFTPVEYCNLNHDERKRVAVLEYCGLHVKGFIRGHEVVEVQQVVLPRINLPWKFIAGAVGAVLGAVLLAPLLMTVLAIGAVLLLALTVGLVHPVTIAVVEDGTPEGLWLELMYYYSPPPVSFISPEEQSWNEGE